MKSLNRQPGTAMPAMRASNASLYLLYLFAFCVPLDLLPEALGLGNQFTPARIVGSLLFLSWFLTKILSRTRVRRSWMLVVCLLLLLYSALSLFWARAWLPGLQYFVSLLQLVIMYVITVDLADSMPKIRRLLLLAAVGGGLVIFAAIYSGIVLKVPRTIFFRDEVGLDPYVPNKVAGCVAFAVAVSASLLANSRKRWTAALSLVYLAAAALSVILTGSRGGMTATAFGVSASFAASMLGPTKGRSRIVGTVILIAILSQAVTWSLVQPLERWQREDTALFGNRPLTWSVMLKAWSSRPLFGLGLGGANDYDSVSAATGSRELVVFEGLSPAGYIAPHNVLVGALVNGGIIYLFLWTLLVFRPLWWLIKLIPLLRAGQLERTVYNALLGAYVIVGIAMMMENVEYTKFLWFTFALMESAGLLVVRRRRILTRASRNVSNTINFARSRLIPQQR